MGVLEEATRTAGGVIDAMRGQPLAIANIVLNIAFLVFLFYYVSIIAQRAQSTVKELFVAQDNLYKQWGVIIKDTNDLTEKAMHCVLPEDILKLQIPHPIERPAPPSGPAPLPQGQKSLLNLPPLPSIPYLPISGDQPIQP